MCSLPVLCLLFRFVSCVFCSHSQIRELEAELERLRELADSAIQAPRTPRSPRASASPPSRRGSDGTKTRLLKEKDAELERLAREKDAAQRENDELMARMGQMLKAVCA